MVVTTAETQSSWLLGGGSVQVRHGLMNGDMKLLFNIFAYMHVYIYIYFYLFTYIYICILHMCFLHAVMGV